MFDNPSFIYLNIWTVICLKYIWYIIFKNWTYNKICIKNLVIFAFDILHLLNDNFNINLKKTGFHGHTLSRANL